MGESSPSGCGGRCGDTGCPGQRHRQSGRVPRWDHRGAWATARSWWHLPGTQAGARGQWCCAGSGLMGAPPPTCSRPAPATWQPLDRFCSTVLCPHLQDFPPPAQVPSSGDGPSVPWTPLSPACWHQATPGPLLLSPVHTSHPLPSRWPRPTGHCPCPLPADPPGPTTPPLGEGGVRSEPQRCSGSQATRPSQAAAPLGPHAGGRGPQQEDFSPSPSCPSFLSAAGRHFGPCGKL